MNTNMKRVISGLAALGIALSGMALGTSSAWAGEGDGEIGTDASTAKGSVFFDGNVKGHTLVGYKIAGYNKGYSIVTDNTGTSAFKDLSLVADAGKDNDVKSALTKAGIDSGDINDLANANGKSNKETTSPWGFTAQSSEASSAIRKFAQELVDLGYNGTTEGDKTADVTSFQIPDEALPYEVKNLEEGLYLFVDTTNGNQATTASVPILVGTTFAKDTTNALNYSAAHKDNTQGYVNMKNYELPVTKQVVKDDGETANEHPDYAIGETIKFELTTTVPNYAGYGKCTSYSTDATNCRTLIMTDTMSKGLTYDGIESVKVDGSDLGAENNYTDSATPESANRGDNDQTVTIDFGKYVNGTPAEAGKTITVVVKAHLNNNAVIADDAAESAPTNGGADTKGNPNKVNLTYSNTPTDLSKKHMTPDTIVNVYTYQFGIDKVNKDNEKLNGAQFVLKYTGLSDGVQAGDKTSADWTGKYLAMDTTTGAWSTLNAKPAADATAGVFTTAGDGDNAGRINFKGLPAGTYEAEEIKAPEGYSLLTGGPKVTFTVTPTYADNASENPLKNVFQKDKIGDHYLSSLTYSSTTSEYGDTEHYDATATVTNYKSITELPMTGGAGLVAVIAAGVLLAGAGVAAAVRSRKSNSRAVRI